MTESGLEKLKKECDELIEARRRMIASKMRAVRNGEDNGDDNGEHYKELLQIERRIAERRHATNHAVLIKKNGGNGSVEIGSTVQVKTKGKRKSFTIVGSLETDPTKGLISCESPVGSALLGAKVGDVVTVSASKPRAYEILRVS